MNPMEKDETDRLYDEAYAKFEHGHGLCPKCLKEPDGPQTLAGPIWRVGEPYIDDINRTSCSCGWKGKLIELVSKDREIMYLKGDATRPIGEGQKLILHICNDIGAWGAGFVLAISKRWKEPENEYRNWSRRGSLGDFKLGEVQLVSVEENIAVINMIAQRDIRWNGNNPPIRYDALETALGKVVEIMQRTDLKDASLHMPRIGCGLAGGKWENIEQILKTQISMKIDNKIYVYDL